MKPLDSLFNLVHSLTEGEKKYFHTHAARHVIGNKNNYEKLFELYCQLPADKPYDEAQLKKLLKGKSYGKNLAVEKKNLYHLILEAMRILHAENTPEYQLNTIIANIRFLNEKSLNDEAMKEVEKGLKLAKETENLHNHLLLYRLKKRIFPYTHTEEGLLELEYDFEQKKNLMHLLKAERTLAFLQSKVHNLYMRNKLAPQIPELKQTLETVMGQIAPLSPTYTCQSGFLVANALIAEKEGKYVNGMKYYEQMLELWEKHPLKMQQPGTYVASLLANYLVCAHHCERFEVFPEIIEKIEKMPGENIREEADLFYQAKVLRLLYRLNTSYTGNSDILIGEVEDGLVRFASLLSRRNKIYLRYNICFLHVFELEYSQLVDAVNRTYEEIGRDENLTSYVLILKFFEIIAHVGLKNYDLLGYQIDNTERWLREHQLKNEFTTLLLKNLRMFVTAHKQSKTDGQLTEVNCPPDMLMLREIYKRWLNAYLKINS